MSGGIQPPFPDLIFQKMLLSVQQCEVKNILENARKLKRLSSNKFEY